MTAHPVPENRDCWWLVAGKERRLHAVPGYAITPLQMRAAIEAGQPTIARAACGLRRRWWLPGLYSRLGRRRCVPCCHALGIPTGDGTPANETARKDQPL
jgi:hypothetical protein